jgi:hypothetical protein
MAETPPDQQKPQEVAEALIWRVLQRDLEREGSPEAGLYLKHLLQAKLEKIEPQGSYKRVTFGMYERISEYTAQYSPITGERRSWFFTAFSERCEQGLSKAQALEVARKAAELPQDAVLEVADYEMQAGEPVFVARWAHFVNGVRVERDYIQVLVNGGLGRAFSVSRHWHMVDEEPSWR